MIRIPEDVERVALTLHAEGYSRAEAYPIALWRKHGWSEEERFFRLVDAYLRLVRAFSE